MFRPHHMFRVKIWTSLSKIMNAILSFVLKLCLTYHVAQSTILRGNLCVCVCVCGLQLIFSNEYTQAEGHNWHLKHFCCFDCDCVLAGETYVMENDKPVCKPCYMKNHAVVKRKNSLLSLSITLLLCCLYLIHRWPCPCGLFKPAILVQFIFTFLSI